MVSFGLKGRDAETVAEHLDRDYAIACRAGLHCAALAHRSLGTTECGTIRFSLGPYTTASDIDAAITAVAALA